MEDYNNEILNVIKEQEKNNIKNIKDRYNLLIQRNICTWIDVYECHHIHSIKDPFFIISFHFTVILCFYLCRLLFSFAYT